MFSGDFLGDFPISEVPLTFPPIITECGASYDELESVLKTEVGGTSSGCDSYDSTTTSFTGYSSAQSFRPTLLQRSVSSHSIHNNNNNNNNNIITGFYPQSVWNNGTDFCDPNSGPVRRVLSAGDLQGGGDNVMQPPSHHRRSDSPLSNEMNTNCIIEGIMNKACRYSPEEKKERIERYKSKRTQRNFNKKIKYACRKTLADSRPRIRGRFARNDEFDKSSAQQAQWSQTSEEESYEDDDNWANFLDALSANLEP